MSLSLLFNTNKHFQSVKDDEYPLTYKYSPSKWERFRHDRQGNLTEWTDARGVVWHIEYGPFDLPVARVDGEGHRWQYRYDLDSLQLVAVVNPQGESYRYQLDADGRVVTETDYAGTQWHYAYDDNSNCIEMRDALGQVTRFEYDAAQRMTAMHTPEGTTTYRYDALGHLLAVAAPGSAPITYEYDEQDRLVREIQQNGEIRRDYPDNQSVSRTVLTDEQQWHMQAAVNNAGEVNVLILGGEECLTRSRDAEGQEWHRQSNKGFILRQEYSLMGQLTAQRAGRNTEIFTADEVADIPQPTLAGLDKEYRYDAALNLVAANDERQWLRYVVNGNGQVTSVSDGDRLREHYQYDAAGYPSRRFDGLNEIDGEWLYQKGHRLRRVGPHLFEYDDAGRMTAMQQWQEGHRPQLTKFRWNSQNQLTHVLTPGGQQWAYRYDAFGRRIEKDCAQTGMRTTYLWDGSTPAEIREYRHDRLYSLRHLVFDGWQLLAQQVQFFTPNPENRRELIAGDIRTHYAVCAPTGEPLALFDTAGHRVWRQPAYSLYGLRLGAAGENAEFDPGLKFAGQWLDEESGLFYNRFRYYSPLAGCYLTPDPIGIQGGENTYGYVPNPTGFIDPLGLAKKKPKEDPRRPASEVPKVKEETYKIVRHVSPEELENIKKAGGKIVLHYDSPRVARWINVPAEQHGYGTVNPNEQKNIHRVTYTVTEKGFRMLDMSNRHLALDFWKFDDGEAGAPDKVFYKGNEKGARGIGVNVLKDFNKEIISAQYETRIGKTKKYSEPKPIIECKGKKKGR